MLEFISDKLEKIVRVVSKWRGNKTLPRVDYADDPISKFLHQKYTLQVISSNVDLAKYDWEEQILYVTVDNRPCRKSHPTPIDDESVCGMCYAFLHDSQYRMLYTGQPSYPGRGRPKKDKGVRALPPPRDGVGTELKGLLTSLGLKACMGCQSWEVRMNKWGVEGCSGEHREEILRHLRSQAGKLGWVDTMKAVALSVISGIALSLDPADPASGLLDEAVRRQVAKKSNSEG